MMNPFDEIHSLWKGKQYDAVFDLLYNAKTAHINAPYSQYAKHAWYILGDICHKKGRFNDAIAFFNKALEARDTEDKVALSLADSYLDLGRPDKAEAVLQQVLRTEPENDDSLYRYGNALFDQGRFRQAAQYYKKVSTADAELYALARRNLKFAEMQQRTAAHSGLGVALASGRHVRSGGTAPVRAGSPRADFDAMPPVAILRPTLPRHQALKRRVARVR